MRPRVVLEVIRPPGSDVEADLSDADTVEFGGAAGARTFLRPHPAGRSGRTRPAAVHRPSASDQWVGCRTAARPPTGREEVAAPFVGELARGAGMNELVARNAICVGAGHQV